MVVAISPLIMSKHEGTVLVISIVFTPASMAVRQAWKPASALSVRRTPQRRLGKTSAIDRIDRLRLVEGSHPLPGWGGPPPHRPTEPGYAGTYVCPGPPPLRAPATRSSARRPSPCSKAATPAPA